MKARRQLLHIALTAAMVIGVLFASGTAAHAEESSSPAGTWVGTYTCSQGPTGLQLDIAAGEGNDLVATFAFYATDSNPDIPSGKYTMRGTYSDEGIELIQDKWVKQPPGWEMVDLRSGPLAKGDTSLAGDVTTEGCKTFSLEKDTPAAPAEWPAEWLTNLTGQDLFNCVVSMTALAGGILDAPRAAMPAMVKAAEVLSTTGDFEVFFTTLTNDTSSDSYWNKLLKAGGSVLYEQIRACYTGMQDAMELTAGQAGRAVGTWLREVIANRR